MSLFTLFPTLRSQPLSRVLHDSRPLWTTLDAFEAITDDSTRPYRGPWIDANETDTAYTFTIELPGFKRDQVSVKVDEQFVSTNVGSTIVVSATRTNKNDDAHRVVDRTIALPTDADPTKVEAKLEDGLLSIVVAKVAKPTPPAPRKVTVS